MSAAGLLLVTALSATVGATAKVPMPGGEQGIGLDDLRYSPELGRLVVPAGRTGSRARTWPRRAPS